MPSLLALALIAAAAPTPNVPLVIQHSGRLLDGTDKPLDASSLALTFSIYDDSDTSKLKDPLWTATYSLPVTGGIYRIGLGDPNVQPVTPLPATLFDTPGRWLEIAIAGEKLSPRLEIGVTPYAVQALHAQNADLFGGMTPDAFAPSTIETDIAAIRTSTDTLGALKTELDAVKASTDTMATTVTTATSALAKASDLASLASTTGTLATAASVTSLASSVSALATTAGSLSTAANVAALQSTASAVKSNTDTIPTLATAASIAALSAKIDALTALLAPTSCPSGMTLVGGAGNKGSYCIDTARTAVNIDFASAAAGCTNRGLRLCTTEEWSAACGAGSFNPSGGEWVAGFPNNGVDRGSPDDYGLRGIMGGGSQCWNSTWAWAGFGNESTAGYRCCR